MEESSQSQRDYEYSIGIVHAVVGDVIGRIIPLYSKEDAEKLVHAINHHVGVDSFTGAVIYQREIVTLKGKWELVKEETRAERGVEEKVEPPMPGHLAGGCAMVVLSGFN